MITEGNQSGRYWGQSRRRKSDREKIYSLSTNYLNAKKEQKKKLGNASEALTNIKMLPTEAYFNPEKKRSLFNEIVDKYFEKKKYKIKVRGKEKKRKYDEVDDEQCSTHFIEQKKIHFNQSLLSQSNPKSKMIKTSFSSRKVHSFFKQKPKETKKLPIIDEVDIIRPMSQHCAKNAYIEQDETLFRLSSGVKTQKQSSNREQLERNKKGERMIYRNNYYELYLEEDSQKQIKRFTQEGNQMFQLIDKINDFPISKLWHLTDYQNKTFISDKKKKSLRQQFFNIKKRQFSDEKLTVIQPTQSYYSLFYSNCEWLLDIIRGIAKQLNAISGRLINNKICLDNIYRVQEKDIRISDWGSSSMRTVHQLSHQLVVNYHESILFDSNGWLIYPEYLAPELLEKLVFGQGSEDIWEGSPDVWSLGCLIYELLTMVPLWMPDKCVIGLKTMKGGMLGLERRNIATLYEKQKKMHFQINKWIREQKNTNSKIPKKIINLMKRMLEYDSKKRPTPQQIIDQLDN